MYRASFLALINAFSIVGVLRCFSASLNLKREKKKPGMGKKLACWRLKKKKRSAMIRQHTTTKEEEERKKKEKRERKKKKESKKRSVTYHRRAAFFFFRCGAEK